MSAYRRFIAYIYSYVEGKKDANAGFAKIESRNGVCKMQIHLQDAREDDGVCRIYAVVKQGEWLLGIYLGMMAMREGSADRRLVMASGQIGGSPHPLDSLQGLWIQKEGREPYATAWVEEPFDVKRLVTEVPRKREEMQPEEAQPKEAQAPEVKQSLEAEEDTNPEESLEVEKGTELVASAEAGEGKKPDESLEAEEDTNPDKNAEAAEAEAPGPEKSAEEGEGKKTEASKAEAGAAETERPEPEAAEGEVPEAGAAETEPSEPEAAEEEVPEPERAETEPSEPEAAEAEVSETEAAEAKLPEIENLEGEPPLMSAVPAEQADAEVGKALESADMTDAESGKDPEISGMARSDSQERWSDGQERWSDSQERVSAQEAALQLDGGANGRPMDQGRGAYNGRMQQSRRPAQRRPAAGRPEPGLEQRWQAMLSRYPSVKPFSDNEIAECIKITPDDLKYLRQNQWKLGKNSFLIHGYYNYRHLLMGRLRGGGYILGVPGVFENQERYMANMFGFTFLNLLTVREQGPDSVTGAAGSSKQGVRMQDPVLGVVLGTEPRAE